MSEVTVEPNGQFGVWKEIEFDAGHRVPDHASKCSNPHGHRYRVRVYCVGHLQREGSSNGMVVDFGRIKEVLTLFVHDLYDHGFIVWEKDVWLMEAFGVGKKYFASGDPRIGWNIIPVAFVPTAENLAADIYETLNNSVLSQECEVRQVEVYETPTSVAVFPA